MIQSYSQNVTVPAQTAIPFTANFTKGCTVQQTSDTTFQFNKKGLYLVQFDAVVSQSTTAGNVLAQLFVNGVAQSRGVTSTAISSATDASAMSFTAYVQVPNDNICDCSVAPTTMQIKTNGTIGALFEQANVVITKLC